MARSMLAFTVILGLMFPLLVHAAPGDLDPNFGVGGKVIGPLFVSPESFRAIDQVIQPDGRIVIVGFSTLDTWYTLTTVRLQTDGTLDPTFGSGGVVTTALGDGHDLGQAVTLQPDGRILVTGEAERSLTNTFDYGDMVVIRYLTDGTLDPSFGDGGVVRTSFDPRTDQAHAVVVQPNGKIVIAGSTAVGSNTAHFALARYEPDGSPDLTFGTGGKVVTPLRDLDSLTSMALQPDGRLVVAGSARLTGSPPDAAVVRYDPDGTLDASFGTGGVFLTTFAPTSTGLNAVALQADGKILGAGFTHDDVLMIRLSAGGALDPTFGSGGALATTIDGAFLASAVLVQPDGRAITAGFRYKASPEDYDFQLVRADAGGVLDPGFGTGGSVVTNVGAFEFARALGRQLDGKLVAAGWGHVSGTPESMVTRYEGTPAACGNGVPEPPETCDDANVAAGDGCDSTCSIEPGFACTGMPSSCTPGCGNGTVAGAETCDDSNLAAGDGCGAACTIEPGWTCAGAPSSCAAVCGDSRVVGTEQCDDGNVNGGDCCTGTCQFESVGSPCLDEPDGCTVDTCGSGGVCQHAFDLDLCPICNDGMLTGDEDCEDGNTADGDCCDASCHLDPVGAPCLADGNFCSNDACDAGGMCQHEEAPDPTCLTPIEPAKAQLQVTDKTNDVVQFKWMKGPALSKSTFGMPASGAPQYALCVYDLSGGSPGSIFKATASGDADCADQACWTEDKRGWRLKNKGGAPDGIVQLKLTAGDVDGKSKVQVKLKGSSLVVPSLPLANDPSVVAQVRSSDGQCYGAVFSTPSKNDGITYRAKSD